MHMAVCKVLVLFQKGLQAHFFGYEVATMHGPRLGSLGGGEKRA